MVAAVPIALLAVLVAGCTAAPAPSRVHEAPFAVPQDLTWQYATNCMSQMTSEGTIVALAFGPEGVDVQFADETPATILDEQVLENCLSQYRFEQRADSFNYVDAFERAQLWDYYRSVTEPCLAAHGVTMPATNRALFFAPDQRPWNPYTAMDDLPFDELVELYEACPPVPDYLRSRHER